jgi:hypothetical protein
MHAPFGGQIMKICAGGPFEPRHRRLGTRRTPTAMSAFAQPLHRVVNRDLD